MKRCLNLMPVALMTTSTIAYSSDVEPNSSFVTAQDILPGETADFTSGDGIVSLLGTNLSGTIGPGDADYYQFTAQFSGSGITLMDVFVSSPNPFDFQVLAFDGESGLVIDFLAFNSADTSTFGLFTIQLQSF